MIDKFANEDRYPKKKNKKTKDENRVAKNQGNKKTLIPHKSYEVMWHY